MPTPVTAKTWSWLISVLASWLNVVGFPPSSRCVLVVDLAAVHAALRVDVVEVRLLAVDQRAEVRRQGPRLRRDGPDRDGVRRHARRSARRRAPALAAVDDDDRGGQGCPREHGRHRRLESLSHSHARPQSSFVASPPGCRSLYLQGFTPIAHPLRSYTSHFSLILFPSPRPRCWSAPFVLCSPAASRHPKNNLRRSKSLRARTSSGRTGANSSTSRATAARSHRGGKGPDPLLDGPRPRAPRRGAAPRPLDAGRPCR